jgi:thiosulfate dehydrogenase [quinone] large subunit
MRNYLVFALRIALGGLFFYAGLSKILKPAWSAAGYLTGAQTFHGFFQWLTTPGIITVVNFVNEWGLLLLGISLLLGLAVRLSTIPGAVLMFLYYLVILHFPYVGQNYFLIDDHIIFIICLLYLYAVNAGKFWGLDSLIKIKRA